MIRRRGTKSLGVRSSSQFCEHFEQKNGKKGTLCAISSLKLALITACAWNFQETWYNLYTFSMKFLFSLPSFPAAPSPSFSSLLSPPSLLIIPGEISDWFSEPLDHSAEPPFIQVKHIFSPSIHPSIHSPLFSLWWCLLAQGVKESVKYSFETHRMTGTSIPRERNCSMDLK